MDVDFKSIHKLGVGSVNLTFRVRPLRFSALHIILAQQITVIFYVCSITHEELITDFVFTIHDT